MNFDLSEEQAVVAELAEQVFAGQTSPERLKQAATEQDYDRRLWAELASTNLIGLCLPESAGGSALGLVELVLLCQAQGRHVAPAPLLATVATARALSESLTGPAPFRDLVQRAVAGEALLTAALEGHRPPSIAATATPTGYRLDGVLPAVPWAVQAAAIIVPACLDGGVALFVVDPTLDGVGLEPVRTTDLQPAAQLTLAAEVPAAARFGDAAAVRRLADEWLIGQCATVLGVCEAAVRQTAEYLVGRTQFGRPLSSFQATGQRAADGYITTEAIRVTTLNAAWRFDQGLPAADELLAAAFWASDGGQQVTVACQHLHGGIGADIDYPIHRYFLWAARLANSLGTASAHLAALGQSIATHAPATATTGAL